MASRKGVNLMLGISGVVSAPFMISSFSFSWDARRLRPAIKIDGSSFLFRCWLSVACTRQPENGNLVIHSNMLYMDRIRSLGKILGHWESCGVFCTRKAPGKSFYDWKICFTSHPSMDTKPIKLDGGTCWHIEAELDNEFRGMFVFLFPKAGWREGARGEAEMKTVTRRKAFLCLWRRQIGNIIQFWEASQILCCQSAFFRP